MRGTIGARHRHLDQSRAGLRRTATAVEQLRAGRLDAVLTFWPYAARLKARASPRDQGEPILADLGISRRRRWSATSFDERLARQRPDCVRLLSGRRQGERYLADRDAPGSASGH